MSKQKTTKRGGRREKSGRHSKEPTIVKRIPVSMVSMVEKLIQSKKSTK